MTTGLFATLSSVVSTVLLYRNEVRLSSTLKGPVNLRSSQQNRLPIRSPLRCRRVGVWLCFAALLVSHGSLRGDDRIAERPSAKPSLPQKIPLHGPIHFQARNIVFHLMDGVHIDVKSVDALILPSAANQPVTLDDSNSMKVEVKSGDTAISEEALSILLNQYALPRSNLPLRDVKVTFENGEAHLTGKLHKLIDLPFSASATVGVTEKGNFHLHFNSMTAAGILHKKLLDFFGLSIADLVKRDQGHIFHIQGDDVDFPLYALFPAPRFIGHMSSATIEGNHLVQVFGVVKPFPPAPVPAEHYLYFRGGVLSLGRLSMQGVDLEMLNMNADQEFEFSMQNIFQQLLPGYLKNLPDHGVVCYIESFHDAAGAGTATQAALESAAGK